MRSSRAICVALVCAAFLDPRVSRGAGPCEVTKLEGDPAFASGFAASLAVSGDYIVVGDPGDSTMGSAAGAAYVFHRVGNAWARQAKIFGSEIGFSDAFGLSVAIEDDRIVIGAPHYDLTSTGWGFAYVFQRVGDGWVEQQKLISSESAIDDRFGWSVSISGNWIAVGAPYQDDYFGRVFLFHWNGSSFVEEASVFGSDTVQFDLFGWAVALREDRLLVGVEFADQQRGKAYVFRNDGNNWLEEAKLTAGDAAPNDRFGRVVSMNGEFAIVGAPATDHTGLSSGSAYIFHRTGSNWTEQANLRGSSPQPSANFGEAVSIYESYALIGAYGHNDGMVENVGASFLYRYADGVWSEVSTFVPDDAHFGLGFGSIIRYDGVNAVIGASSSAYVFAVPGGPPCIPALGGSGLLILAGVLVIAGIALLRRGKLNFTHCDDS